MKFLMYFWVLLEIVVIVLVAEWLGVLPTLLLIILTTALGFLLMRTESRSVIRRIQERLTKGQAPSVRDFESSIVMMAGMLLIIPGFISDAIGLLCLVPFFRRFMLKQMGRQVNKRAQKAQQRQAHQQEKHQDQGHNTIEGEFWEVDKKDAADKDEAKKETDDDKHDDRKDK